MIPWSYQGNPVDIHPDNVKAFVYLMVFADGTKYIGKRNLYSTRRKKVPGKTRRVVTTSENDWRKYLSSSKEVKTKLKAKDKLITREIIRWCYTLGEATYWELHEQMTNHVLLSDTWLNRWVSARIYKQNLKDME